MAENLDYRIKQTRLMLWRVIEWYNYIREKTEICEMNIISKHMSRLDNDLQEATEITTWINYSKCMTLVYIKWVLINIF